MTSLILILMATILMLSGCAPNPTAPTFPTITLETTEPSTATASQSYQISVGGQTFPLYLSDTEPAQAFKSTLPLSVTMEDLHGNEKFHYLPSSLPTASITPGQIRTGDLMLYGNNCLVLFYEDFPSGYSYTPLGRVEDARGLNAAMASKPSVQVTISTAE